MDRDCGLFVGACEMCNTRRTHGLTPTEYKFREDPPFPFQPYVWAMLMPQGRLQGRNSSTS
eukprot:5054163-Prymnesium_polylepis.2